MEKYKVCPSCGEKNNPELIECTYCETDLTRVSLENETSKKEETRQEEQSNNPQMYRICDCGAKNAVASRKCVVCNEDISDISPSEEPQDICKFILASTDGLYAYEIKNDKIAIGREHEMQEYLSSKKYVSRNHAVLTIVNNELFIQNINSTNFTYINNIKLATNEVSKLVDGDEIGLGGYANNGERQSDVGYFLVRIGSCL